MNSIARMTTCLWFFAIGGALSAAEPLVEELAGRVKRIAPFTSDARVRPMFASFVFEISYPPSANEPREALKFFVEKRADVISLAMLNRKYLPILIANPNQGALAVSATTPGRLETVPQFTFQLEWTPKTPFSKWLYFENRIRPGTIDVDPAALIADAIAKAAETRVDSINRRVTFEAEDGTETIVELAPTPHGGWEGIESIRRTYTNDLSISLHTLRQGITNSRGGSSILATYRADVSPAEAIRAEMSQEWFQNLVSPQFLKATSQGELEQAAKRLDSLLPRTGTAEERAALQRAVAAVAESVESATPNADLTVDALKLLILTLDQCVDKAVSTTSVTPYRRDSASASRRQSAEYFALLVGRAATERLRQALLKLAGGTSDDLAAVSVYIASRIGVGEEGAVAAWQTSMDLHRGSLRRQAWSLARLLLRFGREEDVIEAKVAAGDPQSVNQQMLLAEVAAQGSVKLEKHVLLRMSLFGAREDNCAGMGMLRALCGIPEARPTLVVLLKDRRCPVDLRIELACGLLNLEAPPELLAEIVSVIKALVIDQEAPEQARASLALAIAPHITEPALLELVRKKSRERGGVWSVVLASLSEQAKWCGLENEAEFRRFLKSLPDDAREAYVRGVAFNAAAGHDDSRRCLESVPPLLRDRLPAIQQQALLAVRLRKFSGREIPRPVVTAIIDLLADTSQPDLSLSAFDTLNQISDTQLSKTFLPREGFQEGVFNRPDAEEWWNRSRTTIVRAARAWERSR